MQARVSRKATCSRTNERGPPSRSGAVECMATNDASKTHDWVYNSVPYSSRPALQLRRLYVVPKVYRQHCPLSGLQQDQGRAVTPCCHGQLSPCACRCHDLDSCKWPSLGYIHSGPHFMVRCHLMRSWRVDALLRVAGHSRS